MLAIVTPVISNLYLIIWLAGFIFLWWSTKNNRRTRKWGLIFLLGLWFVGTRPVAELILTPLEIQYKTPKVQELKDKGISQIVVLTGGGFPVQGEVLSSAFPQASLYRFLGGLELCQRLGPACAIIFSGAAGRQQPTRKTSEDMENLALVVSPAVKAASESISQSTEEHPLAIKPLLKPGPFVLVTSAFHLPRSVRSFRKAGLDPIPYPVHFLAKGDYHWPDWLPSFGSYWMLNVAFREYLALALYRFRE